MGYCVYMTRAGYALQAKLFAEGGELEIIRVEVGSGTLSEGVDPGTLTELAAFRSAATSTRPVRRDCAVDLAVEYRSDLNSEMEEAFLITEFGLFALDSEGEETLILYGDLSDYPESAVPLKFGGCVRRYPVHLEIGPAANVTLDYPAGAWATWEEMSDAIEAHNSDPNAHAEAFSRIAGEIFKKGGVLTTVITIPADGWWEDDDGPGAYCAEVACEDAVDAHIPYVSLDKPSMETAESCGFSDKVEAVDGALRFWANAAPQADIVGRAALFGPGGGAGGASGALPVATAEKPGVVKVGRGLNIGSDGTLSIGFANETEVNELLNEVFAPDNE